MFLSPVLDCSADATPAIGVALIYLILRALTHVFTDVFQLKGFESGQYGKPPSIKYWSRQAAVYVLSLTSMKLLVVGLFALCPDLIKIGEWLLSWTRTGNKDAFQVILWALSLGFTLCICDLILSLSTMGIFPILMNIVQFWLIDSIVKASELVLQTDPQMQSNEDNQDREPLIGPHSHDDDEMDTRSNPPHDIENPLSSSQSGDATKVGTPNELKSTSSGVTTPIGISDGGNSIVTHAYPPSISNTPSSRKSSMSHPTNMPSNKSKQVPAPLHLQPAHTLALNSPERTIHSDPTPQLHRSISSHLIEQIKRDSNMDWVSSWDDSDDWVNKVGEENRTEKRMRHDGTLIQARVVAASPLPAGCWNWIIIILLLFNLWVNHL